MKIFVFNVKHLRSDYFQMNNFFVFLVSYIELPTGPSIHFHE